jgi:hypothetical protein
MAFDLQKLSLITQQGAGLGNHWRYESSADAVAAINTAGYMDNASDRLTVGDVITVFDSAGAVATLLVASNAAGVVDLTDGVVVTATDSD